MSIISCEDSALLAINNYLSWCVLINNTKWEYNNTMENKYHWFNSSINNYADLWSLVSGLLPLGSQHLQQQHNTTVVVLLLFAYMYMCGTCVHTQMYPGSTPEGAFCKHDHCHKQQQQHEHLIHSSLQLARLGHQHNYDAVCSMCSWTCAHNSTTKG